MGSRTLRPCGGFSQNFGYGFVEQGIKETPIPSYNHEIFIESSSVLVAEDVMMNKTHIVYIHPGQWCVWGEGGRHESNEHSTVASVRKHVGHERLLQEILTWPGK